MLKSAACLFLSMEIFFYVWMASSKRFHMYPTVTCCRISFSPGTDLTTLVATRQSRSAVFPAPGDIFADRAAFVFPYSLLSLCNVMENLQTIRTVNSHRQCSDVYVPGLQLPACPDQLRQRLQSSVPGLSISLSDSATRIRCL